jgi:hypothetical protein
MVSTLAIERLWLHIIAYRIWRRIEEQRQMSRLRDLVAQAAAVAPRRAASIEARARALIASEPDLEAEEREAFGMHESVLNEASASIDDLKHALAPLSNNPPSERSVPLSSGSVMPPNALAGVGDLNLPHPAPEPLQAHGGPNDVKLIRS